MKKTLSAALILCTVAFAAESPAASKADDAIKQVLAQLDRCFAANDPSCLGALFVDDATYAAPTGEAKILEGREPILKALTESMGALKKQNMKLTHTLANVRMIGEDHAVVDITIAVGGEKPPKDDAGNPHRDSYRAVAVMALEQGKWLCRDLRSYVIGSAQPAPQNSAPAAQQDSAPPADKEPGAPEKNEPAPPTQG